MPTLQVYIRVDDLEKWKALSNKSEFIHNALNPVSRDAFRYSPGARTGDEIANRIKPIKTPDAPIINQPAKNKVNETLGLCKHGADPKFCKHAKPGKPCK